MRIITASLVICALVTGAPAAVFAQGYEGLFAPATPDAAPSAPSNAAGGYDGLLTPAEDNAAPSGYAGLLPGQVAEPVPQFTAIPGSGPATNIRTLSLLHGQDRNGDGVPDGITRPQKLFNFDAPIRDNGVSPAQQMVENNIKQLILPLRNERLSTAERTLKARQAYQELAELAEGYRHKKSVPDRIYRQMGLSDVYIEQEKADLDSNLARLDRTLASLKKYQ